jgi:hypothetical protein
LYSNYEDEIEVTAGAQLENIFPSESHGHSNFKTVRPPLQPGPLKLGRRPGGGGAAAAGRCALTVRRHRGSLQP